MGCGSAPAFSRMSGRAHNTSSRSTARPVGFWIVVVVLAILIYALWYYGSSFYQIDLDARVEHKDYDDLRPGGMVGHGYGIVGTGLILTNLLYLVRRRLARWSLGSMRAWLNLHVFTGLFGSTLVLFHSAFQFRTPIAVVTAVSLGVVVVTGVLGRYLYALTPQPNAERLEEAVAVLEEFAPGCRTRIRHALAVHKVTQIDAHRWMVAKFAMVPRWAIDARNRGFLVSYVVEDVPLTRVLSRKEQRQFRKAKRAVRTYATQQVVSIGAVSLLQSWRGLHRGLALLLVLLVPVHIGVAWVYGYRWIWSQ